MSRKIFPITLVCLIFFIGLIQTAPLNKRQFDPETAYVDLSDSDSPEIPEGRITFANFDSVRMTGQFNKGFISPNVNDYEFIVMDKKGNTKMNFSKEIRKQIHINVPGTSPFQVDCENVFVKDFVKNFFAVKYKGKTIGKAEIIGVK